MQQVRLRVGCVPYLNARPLVALLETEQGRAEAECVCETPARLAEMLREGMLDVAIVSSIEALRRADVSVVPGISIAADGPVRSVRLLSRRPLHQIRSLALDAGSLTSVALCRILLAEQYGVRPTCTVMQPNLASMLDRCDAALLIGDPALACADQGCTLDLGEGWKRLTGMPFVYAAWMLAGTQRAADVVQILTKAKAWGQERLSELAEDWSNRTGLPRDVTVPYLTETMQYDLDDAKQESLRVFGELCVAHGLLEGLSPLRQCRPPSLGHML